MKNSAVSIKAMNISSASQSVISGVMDIAEAAGSNGLTLKMKAMDTSLSMNDMALKIIAVATFEHDPELAISALGNVMEIQKTAFRLAAFPSALNDAGLNENIMDITRA